MSNTCFGAADLQALCIRLNGQEHQVAPGTTLAQLLEPLQQEGSNYATAINGEFVPRTQRAHRALANGDRVDCFRQITGG